MTFSFSDLHTRVADADVLLAAFPDESVETVMHLFETIGNVVDTVAIMRESGARINVNGYAVPVSSSLWSIAFGLDVEESSGANRE